MGNNYIEEKSNNLEKYDNFSNASKYAKNSGGYVLKMNLAGSGDEAWRKKINSNKYLAGSNVRNAEPSLIDKIKNLFFGQKIIEEEVGHFYGDDISENKDGLVRKKNKRINDSQGKKTTINMAGPLALRGMSDSGEYCIENNVERGLKLIIEKINKKLNKNKAKSILIYIKGHSRNAVTTSRILVSLSNIYKNRKNIKIVAEQFDPVPGPMHFGFDSEIDYEEALKSGNISNVLIQSLKTEHNFFFTPQKVLNAQKLILVKFEHDAGLNKRKSYQYKEKIYHGFDLSNLPDGVYLHQGSKNDQVAKINKCEKSQLPILIKEIEKTGGFSQWKRTNILKETVIQKLNGNNQPNNVGQFQDSVENDNNENESNKLYDAADPRLVKYCTWTQVPLLKQRRNDTIKTKEVNLSLLNLKRKIKENGDENVKLNETKILRTNVKQRSVQYINSHLFAWNQNISRKNLYCKSLVEKINKEERN